MSNEWVPAQYCCPPDDVDVLMFDGFYYRIGHCHRYSTPTVGVEWFDSHDQDWNGKATHWMSLPSVPNR